MLNFGASKPRVKGGPRPLGPPLDLHLVSQHTLQVSRPTPKREVEGSGRGAWGSQSPHLVGSPGPHLGCLQAHTRGVSRPTLGGFSRPTPRRGVSQHALRQNPPYRNAFLLKMLRKRCPMMERFSCSFKFPAFSTK